MAGQKQVETNRVELTGQQKKALSFIRTHITRHGYPPTLKQISEKLGLSNGGSALVHVNALEKKGLIHRDRNRSRSIRILQQGK